MVFQDALSSLNPVRTIGAQMAETLRLHLNLRGAAARRRTIDFLGRVGIPSPAEQLGAYPISSAAGMQQRVMIAMALSCEPRVLLADEPTTALDVSVQAQILELLRSVTGEFGTALVMISHDLSIVAGLADRVAVMYAGEIVETGATDRIFERPQHPYTLGLLECVPRIDEDASGRSARRSRAHRPTSRDLPVGCFFAARCPFQMERCLTDHPAARGQAGRAAGGLLGGPGCRREPGRASSPSRRASSRPSCDGPAARRTGRPRRRAAPRNKGRVGAVRRSRVGFASGRNGGRFEPCGTSRFAVRPGETLGLVGESGSGKSTLARAILRVEDTASGDISSTAAASSARRTRTSAACGLVCRWCFRTRTARSTHAERCSRPSPSRGRSTRASPGRRSGARSTRFSKLSGSTSDFWPPAARAERRPAAAREHRARARARPRARDRRREHVGARRLGAGADPAISCSRSRPSAA